jgi:hypothetical protein
MIELRYSFGSNVLIILTLRCACFVTKSLNGFSSTRIKKRLRSTTHGAYGTHRASGAHGTFGNNWTEAQS